MSTDGRTSLDIILPCYNPAAGWEEEIVRSMLIIRTALPDAELGLVLVNDGSSKGYSPEKAGALRESLPGIQVLIEENPENKGKGNALRRGVRAGKGDFQIYTDVDFPYEEQSLLDLFHRLKNDEADVVAGVRDASYYKDVPGPRKRISRFVRWLLRTFLRLQITDTQCGLKGFNRKGRALFLETRIDRFLFDMEFVFLASTRPEVRLLPAEVKLKPDIRFSRMHWGILLREGWNFLGIFFRFLFSR